jgi:hypothetical protein
MYVGAPQKQGQSYCAEHFARIGFRDEGISEALNGCNFSQLESCFEVGTILWILLH